MNYTMINKMDLMLETLLKLETSDKRRSHFEDMLQKPVMTNSDLSILLDISIRTIYSWRVNKEIAYLKLSGRYYYLKADVIALLESKHNGISDGNKSI